jgi:hypothetical protein
MRIRIVRLPSKPDIDGVTLSSFQLDQEYLVGSAIGTVLLLEGWAELVVSDDDPPRAEDPPTFARGRSPGDTPIVVAADAKPRRKPE